jgi:acyl-homoserine-lactone acylase
MRRTRLVNAAFMLIALVLGLLVALASWEPVFAEQPYGAATTRPGSPHYADQAPLFAAQRFKPVHFVRADAARHAVRRIVVSN